MFRKTYATFFLVKLKLRCIVTLSREAILSCFGILLYAHMGANSFMLEKTLFGRVSSARTLNMKSLKCFPLLK